MTEEVSTPEAYSMDDVTRSFVLHWGEMASRWGISRTVAQIHALLYIAPRPLHAEEIVAELSLARSTVSTSLRELQSWGVIRLLHVLGDRRDHFEALDDVWEMFRLVLDERKRREVDPTVELLRAGVEQARAEAGGEQTYAKLQELLDFFESISALYEKTRSVPTGVVKRLARSGDRVRELVNASQDG
ncbi:MAG TPA: MarR family transcriptional regulator [Anaerolineales bacterium]|jgi:DNA-binding transcriptional regulator GbsR (MarR family)